MLHEILLSLSGQPSPLLNIQSEEGNLAQDAFPLVSPPERALLLPLARLSRLHARLRARTSAILSSHPSVICRAVSTAIVAELGNFQKKVLDVEKAILVEDSAYVGGYGIVPLSTIAGEFAPWMRSLDWLWELVCFVQPESKKNTSRRGCTGAALMDRLRAESQTGYVDVEEIALRLVTAAETAWMRQLSMWLLYGNLPMHGKDDFFIQQKSEIQGDLSPAAEHFSPHSDLLPKFVSLHTASSILFIGKSLNHIRAKGNAGTPNSLSTSQVSLQRQHIEYLAALKSPISTVDISNAVSAIRASLSQTTLSKMLPLPKILEVLSLLHDFLLLRRGEFAMALVMHADARLNERHRRPETRRKVVGSLEGLSIKAGDVAATLAESFTELYSLQNQEDPVDDELDLARDLLRLSVNDSENAESLTPPQDTAGTGLMGEISDVSFDDLLFPTPTSLTLQVHPPLDLFLSSADISIYSKIHSYLLGIRRAQIRLGDLWKHTSLRRSYPSPWGPPQSCSLFGQNKLRIGRERDSVRIRQMRSVWATSSISLFVLSEIGSFFQGEIVNGSWQHFRQWTAGNLSQTAARGSRPGTASEQKKDDHITSPEKSSTSGLQAQHDPETLTAAHRRYLSTLVQSLFLNSAPFTKSLRSLLTSIDHFAALVIRLENIQRNVDLETDEGVVDALNDYDSEEQEVWQDLHTTRQDIETQIKEVVDKLREIDDSRSGEGQRRFDFSNSTHLQNGNHACKYVPRKPAGVDRLLMKLDFGNFNSVIGSGIATAEME